MSMIVNRRDLAFLSYETLFLDVTGHVVVSWMWLEPGVAAFVGESRQITRQELLSSKSFCHGFFYRYELPKIKAKLHLVNGLDNTCYSLSFEQYTGHLFTDAICRTSRSDP